MQEKQWFIGAEGNKTGCTGKEINKKQELRSLADRVEQGLCKTPRVQVKLY